MKFGFVTGSLWNGRQNSALDGAKLLIVRYVDRTMSPTDDFAVCNDAVGAGTGEWVITVSGSSARLTDSTRDCATDTTIVGIVDRLDLAEPWRSEVKE